MAKRKFNKWLLLALGAGLILLALLMATTGEREPSYEGKALGKWLDQVYEERREVAFGKRAKGEVDASPATLAIRNMGVGVTPQLLRRLRARETWLTRAQDWLGYYFEFVPPTPDVIRLQQQAKLGFEILGTNAWPAIPELSGLLIDTNSAMQAAASLCELGAPGVKTIHTALLDPEISDAARAEIVMALTWRTSMYQAEIDQTEILPVVMNLLDSRVEFLRVVSALYFSRIRGEPEVVVPQLAARLDHPDPKTRAYIAKALGSYGTNATSVIPRLEALLLQPNAAGPVKTLHDFYRAAIKDIRGLVRSSPTPAPAE